VNVVGAVQPTRKQETEAVREGEGVKVSRFQARSIGRELFFQGYQ